MRIIKALLISVVPAVLSISVGLGAWPQSSAPPPSNPPTETSAQPDASSATGGSQKTLKGSITVDSFEANLLVLLEEIDRLELGGDVGVPSVQQNLDDDFVKFDALKGESEVAGKYAACVEEYKQANNHLLEASDIGERTRRRLQTGTATNAELAASAQQQKLELDYGSALRDKAHERQLQIYCAKAGVCPGVRNDYPPARKVQPPPGKGQKRGTGNGQFSFTFQGYVSYQDVHGAPQGQSVTIRFTGDQPATPVTSKPLEGQGPILTVTGRVEKQAGTGMLVFHISSITDKFGNPSYAVNVELPLLP